MEDWKSIPEFSRYEISTEGNIRSIYRTLKPHIKNGYYSIALIDNDGKRRGMLLHRIVALTYLDNPDNKQTVNHIDGNKTNNKIGNLEWATNSEQNIHKNLNVDKKEFSTVSSRPVQLYDVNTNETLNTFKTAVLACKWIYDNNLQIFQIYKSFNDAKSTIKARMCRTLRNNLSNGILYEKYRIKYIEEEIQNERWELIPPEIIDGIKNTFVSTMGRVKNYRGRITRGFIHTNGYTKCVLSTKCHSIHRLVALVFIPNPENKIQVNHKDGNKQNNCIDNLEWNTASENCIHRTNVVMKCKK